MNNNETESTLVLIKPDGMKHYEEIIDMFLDEGLDVIYEDKRKLDAVTLAEHYAHIADRDFYPQLRDYMLSDDVTVLVIKGESAIGKVRNLVGPTDSALAPEWTIRGKYGTNKMYNAVHASDSRESAKVEIKRFVK